MNDLFWQLIDLCIAVEKFMILVYILSWWLRYWVVDDWKNDLNHWDCGLEFVDMDWSDELCEIVCVWWQWVSYLNGWLICGKPREKMRLKAYVELWDENWAMWNCTKWLNWKRYPERQKIELKKVSRKEKYWNEKRCPNGKRMWWER